MSKKINIRQGDVGRFLTVYYEDTGKQDALLIEVMDKDDFRVYLLSHECMDRIDRSQIVALGPYVVAPRF